MTNPDMWDVEVLGNLTYGDGVYIYKIPEVAELKTQQILKTNKLFEQAGISTAITGDIEGGYVTEKMEAIPLEVVFRYKITGSALEKYPYYQDGDTPESGMMFEVNFKDSVFREPDGTLRVLPESETVGYPVENRYTDPLVNLVEQENGEYKWFLHPNHGEFNANEPLIEIVPVVDAKTLNTILNTAEKSSEVLKSRIEANGGELIDGKFEFGRDKDGNIVLLEAITLDEIRTKYEGRQRSKQVFRDIVEEKISQIKVDLSDDPKSQEQMWKQVPNMQKAKEVFALFTKEDDERLIGIYKKGVEMVSAPVLGNQQKPGTAPGAELA